MQCPVPESCLACTHSTRRLPTTALTNLYGVVSARAQRLRLEDELKEFEHDNKHRARSQLLNLFEQVTAHRAHIRQREVGGCCSQ